MFFYGSLMKFHEEKIQGYKKKFLKLFLKNAQIFFFKIQFIFLRLS